MPTYEYRCTSCGHEWEFEQSIKEEPQKVCQKCNQATAQRQISGGGGFILKGGGWYADLYSSSGNKAPAKESGESSKSESSSSSETKTSTSSESKSESSSSGDASTPTKSSSPVAAA